MFTAGLTNKNPTGFSWKGGGSSGSTDKSGVEGQGLHPKKMGLQPHRSHDGMKKVLDPTGGTTDPKRNMEFKNGT